MNKDQFVESLGGMYEHSPWVAEAAFDHGPPELGDVTALVAAMRAEVDTASAPAQMALLRAHPDLAGKLAVSGELTADSTAEQASAGLDNCSAAEFERFQTFNSTYVEKFGFPFIMAVKGSNRQAILQAFERRVCNDASTEFATALEQVHRIAELRIQDWFQSLGEN